MGALPQALEVIFEVQKKSSDEKITRRKISFSLYKRCFYFYLFIYFKSFFSSFWTPLTFKPHNFFFYSF
jgi:hypothetical protein